MKIMQHAKLKKIYFSIPEEPKKQFQRYIFLHPTTLKPLALGYTLKSLDEIEQTAILEYETD